MGKLCVVLTCFNRKIKTKECIQTLVEKNKMVDMRFVVVDDNSTDGTSEELRKLPYNIKLINGEGNLFWNRGMHKGIEYVINNNIDMDYCLLVNDDVSFFENSIEMIISQHKQIGTKNGVIVGATCDIDTKLTYGGILKKSKNSLKYITVEPSSNLIECDTLNANCVLIPKDVITSIGNLDPYYSHSMGDFDYGFKLVRNGYKIFSSCNYVGICERNKIEGTWEDRSLSLIKRIKLRESPKGLPIKEWFYFINKNYNIQLAIKCIIKSFIKMLK